MMQQELTEIKTRTRADVMRNAEKRKRERESERKQLGQGCVGYGK